MANYLAGLKAIFVDYGLDHIIFVDDRLQMYLKSLDKQTLTFIYLGFYITFNTVRRSYHDG